jgi:F-type H+-transporting ATPase subunit c
MDEITVKIAAYIGAAFVMAISTIGPAFGQGMIGSKAVENIGKYPESAGKIRTAMIMALAIVESLAVYGLVIAILLIMR